MMTFKNPRQRLVYIGPSLSRARLRRYQIFIGLPTYLDAEFTACPEIERLFIPVEELTEAKRECAHKGTALYTFYQTVLKNKEV